jgi:hypothetical protein
MNTFFKATVAVAFTAAIGFGQSAKADEVITTVFTSPVIVSSRTCTTTSEACPKIGSGPGFLVTNAMGQEMMIPSIQNPNPILFVTTGAEITGFTCYRPDDLVTRRDDLLARVFAEKTNGKLSEDQANTLISEVQDTYAERLNVPAGGECDVDHVKAVKKIYRNFDRVSNDIMKDSKQGNKQLAGNYNYVAL